MAAWVTVGLGQWRDTEDEDQRHVLVKVGTQYKELAWGFVHRYNGPAVVADNAWPLGSPWTMDPDNPPCVWSSTQEASPPLGLSLVALLAWLVALVLPS